MEKAASQGLTELEQRGDVTVSSRHASFIVSGWFRLDGGWLIWRELNGGDSFALCDVAAVVAFKPYEMERETTSAETYNYYDVVTESGRVIWSDYSYGAALLWAKDYATRHDAIVEVKGWQ